MRYIVTKNNKTLSFILMAIGIFSIALAFVSDSHRAWSSLLLGNHYFLVISLAAVFFMAIQYVGEAGWSVVVSRVFQAIGSYLWIPGLVMIFIFLAGHHDLYHWTHAELHDKASPEYDPIIDHKSGYLNMPFFIIRMVLYVAIWSGFAIFIRKESLKADLDGNISHYRKNVRNAAAFLVLFAVTSSTSSWDFMMSLDPHFFSTLFGWYNFASMFTASLSVICMMTIYLKSKGYLENVNSNHLHNIGLFMFGFSVFWTYLWFAQFMLIWYANLPEEVAWFVERFTHYRVLIALNIIINFFFPFLTLMSRDSKRKTTYLLVAAIAMFIGHWIDFFLMIMPSTQGSHWSIGIPEIGITLGFAGLFLFVVFNALAKAPIVPKEHPFLEESIHHHL
jgi:hypothetical protein